jgi:hypothetical protein
MSNLKNDLRAVVRSWRIGRINATQARWTCEMLQSFYNS